MIDSSLILKRPEEVRLQAIRQQCSRDLLAFVREFWRVIDPNEPFVMGWVLEAIADHLMAVTDGDIKRLLINVWPGCTKSLMTDCFYPAWEWAIGMPSLRYISAAYTGKLTTKSNRAFARLIQHDHYQRLFGHVFQPEKTGEHLITNDKTGFKLATSVEGVGTGERANRIIIDDPNNPKDVESDTVREGTNLWFREVMPDRLINPKESAIIVIQQRTHDRDVSGTILELLGGDYVHLCLPAEYEPQYHCGYGRGTPLLWEDPRGCYLEEDSDGIVQIGEGDDAKTYSPVLDDEGKPKLLPGLMPPGHEPRVIEHSPILKRQGVNGWPQRFSKAFLDEQKVIKGPWAWSGQYQQNPVPRGASLLRVEWWRIWDDAQYPEFDVVLTSVDTAIKEGEENDYNACTTWGIFTGPQGNPCIMLIKAWRTRTDLATLAKMIGDTCKGLMDWETDKNGRFQPRGGRKPIIIAPSDYLLVEDKTRGHDVVAEIRRQFQRQSWSTHLLAPFGDKLSRVRTVQPLFSGRAVHFDAQTGITTWEGGLVYAPNVDWADEVIREAERFPVGEHDDYVDSLSQALLFIRNGGAIVTKQEHEAEQEEQRRFKPRQKPIYNV